MNTSSAVLERPVRQQALIPGSVSGWGIVCLTLLGLLALARSPELMEAWRFDRDAIRFGETWRMITGHFVHVDPLHGAMNLAAILLSIWVFRVWTPLILLSQCLFMAVVLSLALWFMTPELQWYVGLSGIVHGLVVYGAARRGMLGDHLFWGVLILIAIKLVLEQTAAVPPVLPGDSGVPVVVDVHLYGALAGILLASATCLTVSDDY